MSEYDIMKKLKNEALQIEYFSSAMLLATDFENADFLLRQIITHALDLRDLAAARIREREHT